MLSNVRHHSLKSKFEASEHSVVDECLRCKPHLGVPFNLDKVAKQKIVLRLKGPTMLHDVHKERPCSLLVCPLQSHV